MSLHRCPVCRRPAWKRRTLCMDCEKTYKKQRRKCLVVMPHQSCTLEYKKGDGLNV